MNSVLDASAVLAMLNQEPGGELVVEELSDSVMSLVNAVEVGSKLIDGGMSINAAWEALDLLDVPLIDLDPELAMVTTALREPTRPRGLSLGDRACLSLAIKRGGTAVTADKAWGGLDVGCPIKVIR